MKHHELLFSLLKIPLDFCIVIGAFFLAKEIRLITDGIPGVVLPVRSIPGDTLLIFALFGALLYIVVFSLHHLYKLQVSHSKIAEILSVVHYSFYWFLFYSLWVYLGKGILYDGDEIPRLIILFTMILSMFGSSIMRIFLNSLQGYLLKIGKLGARNIVLVSNESDAKLKNIVRDIEKSKIYSIIWYSNSSENPGSNMNFIGDMDELESLLASRSVDEILYISSDYTKSELYHIWELAKIYGVRYRYITNNFDITKTNTTLSLIYQTPVIEIQNTPLEHWGRIIKRISDVLFSLGILVIGFPIFCIIAILIKLEDPSGPIVYKNRRIGQHGKLFNCYKFRYLKWKYCVKESYGVENAEDPAMEYEKELIEKNNSRSWPLYKIQNDPRKTRVWTFLEKYSLDELPQFFNVIRGDMSIVWPRPHQPREVMHYELYQKRLLTIKPGITGMAQVNGREKNNFETEAKLDIFYIENWSFLLDLKIVGKTLAIILSRK